MKTEQGLAGVKTEPGLDDAAALKWAWEDWAWLELERQRRALQEIAARRRGRDEGGVVVLDNNNDDAPLPPSARGTRAGVQQGRPRERGEGRRRLRRRR